METAWDALIRAKLPFLSSLLDDLSPIRHPVPGRVPVAEAVVKTVTAQLLSAAAARTIYGRIHAARNAAGLSGSWMLPEDTMRSCGLSARKTRSIAQFAAAYAKDPERIERWPLTCH